MLNAKHSMCASQSILCQTGLGAEAAVLEHLNLLISLQSCAANLEALCMTVSAGLSPYPPTPVSELVSSILGGFVH